MVGVFPRVSLDLPRQHDQDGVYDAMEKDARENVVAMLRKQQHLAALKEDQAGEVEEELVKLVDVDENGEEIRENVSGEAISAECEDNQERYKIFASVSFKDL